MSGTSALSTGYAMRTTARLVTMPPVALSSFPFTGALRCSMLVSIARSSPRSAPPILPRMSAGSDGVLVAYSKKNIFGQAHGGQPLPLQSLFSELNFLDSTRDT